MRSFAIPEEIVEPSVHLSASQCEAMLHHKLLWEPEYIFVENCGRDESTFIVDGRHKYNYKETSVMTGYEMWRCGWRPNCDATLWVSACHKTIFLKNDTSVNQSTLMFSLSRLHANCWHKKKAAAIRLCHSNCCLLRVLSLSSTGNSEHGEYHPANQLVKSKD